MNYLKFERNENTGELLAIDGNGQVAATIQKLFGTNVYGVIVSCEYDPETDTDCYIHSEYPTEAEAVEAMNKIELEIVYG